MDERSRVLIEELRHMRAARKVTQEELARAINYSPSTVAMVETEARKPPPDFWERADAALDTGGAFVRMLARLGSPQWMREWEANERQATVLRSFQNTVVPGLLQTSAYAARCSAASASTTTRRWSGGWRRDWPGRRCSPASDRRNWSPCSTSTCCAGRSVGRW